MIQISLNFFRGNAAVTMHLAVKMFVTCFSSVTNDALLLTAAVDFSKLDENCLRVTRIFYISYHCVISVFIRSALFATINAMCVEMPINKCNF